MMRLRTSGFTLIELLVVISIIGVLSSVSLASLKEAKDKALDSTRVSETKGLKTALELYFIDHNAYPEPSEYGPPDTALKISKLLPYLTPTYVPRISGTLWGDLDQYTYSSSGNGYGLYIFTSASNQWCKTGVNMNPAWWNSAPDCSF